MDAPAYLRDLNVAQRAAVEHGISYPGSAEIPGPLLIIAGAGTGKTSTLAHRVAHLILTGTPPERILLLTFTRRGRRDDKPGAAYPWHRTGNAKEQSLGVGWRDFLVRYLPCDRQQIAP